MKNDMYLIRRENFDVRELETGSPILGFHTIWLMFNGCPRRSRNGRPPGDSRPRGVSSPAWGRGCAGSSIPCLDRPGRGSVRHRRSD